MSRLLRANIRGVPLYLLGESMGGAVVITAATGWAGAAAPQGRRHDPGRPGGLGAADDECVLARRALGGGSRRAALAAHRSGLHILPSDNIRCCAQLSRDPLVIKETRVDTINGLVDHGRGARSGAATEAAHPPALWRE